MIVNKFFLALMIVFVTLPVFAADKKKESSYDRIVRTKEIRCGYLPYEPYISKDAVTGDLGGLIFDYVNAVAVRHGMKVDWAEEVNIDQIVPALEYGRIDAFCLPATPDENWSKRLGFSAGLGATPYYVYVRAEENISDEALKTARFATVDGYALTEITHDYFPDADYLSMPQTTSMAEMYEQLRYKKADAIVNDHISASLYMKHNPGVIRQLFAEPVVAMRMFLVNRVDDKKMAEFLKSSFDVEISENLVLMRELLEKYNVSDGAILLGKECGEKVENEKGEKLCVLGSEL